LTGCPGCAVELVRVLPAARPAPRGSNGELVTALASLAPAFGPERPQPPAAGDLATPTGGAA
jgi:hypothetical protein